MSRFGRLQEFVEDYAGINVRSAEVARLQESEYRGLAALRDDAEDLALQVIEDYDGYGQAAVGGIGTMRRREIAQQSRRA